MFAKGFLLPKKKSSRPRDATAVRPAASTALLDWEVTAASKESTSAPLSSSFLLVGPVGGSQEKTTPLKAPNKQSLSPVFSVVSKASAEDPAVQEEHHAVSSTGQQNRSLATPMLMQVDERAELPPPTDAHIATTRTSPATPPPTDYVQFTTALAQVYRQMRGPRASPSSAKRDHASVVGDFLQKQGVVEDKERQAMICRNLFQLSALQVVATPSLSDKRTVRQRRPEIDLALGMVRMVPGSVVQLVQSWVDDCATAAKPRKDDEDGSFLQASSLHKLMMFLSTHFLERDTTSCRQGDDTLVVVWMEELVPLLLQLLLLAGPEERTVWKQAVLDFVQQLWDNASRQVVAHPDAHKDELALSAWQGRCHVDTVCRLQLGWIGKSGPKKELYQCRRAVVLDWQRLLGYNLVADPSAVVETSHNITDAGRQWCQHVQGDLGPGSLYNTTLATGNVTYDQAVASLQQAGAGSVQPEAAIHPDPLLQRSHCRVVLAWLGHRSKHAKQLVQDHTAACQSAAWTLMQSNCLAIAHDLGLILLALLQEHTEMSSLSVQNQLADIVLLLGDASRYSCDGGTARVSALEGLAARLLCSNEVSLLHQFWDKHGTTAVSCRILAAIVASEYVAEQICDGIFDVVTKEWPPCDIVFELLQSTPDMFMHCTPSTTINGLVRLLSTTSQEHVQVETVDSVVECLVALLQSLSQKDMTADAVKLLVESLLIYERDSVVLEMLCSQIGKRWKCLFLGSPPLLAGYRDSLTATVHALFAAPSSLIPLTLFGGLQLTEQELQSGASVDMVDYVISLSELCVSELVRVDQAVDDTIFARLAPLLLLRRTPAFLFQLRKEEDLSTEITYDRRERTTRTWSELCRHLRMRMAQNSATGAIQYSEDERRLSAEIVVRFLPLDTQQIRQCPGIYDYFCKAAFEMQSTQWNVASVRYARACLYTVCLWIVDADPTVQAVSLGDVARFALGVLADEDGAHGPEWDRLEAGCVEFLALCFETRAKNGAVASNSSPDSLPLCLDNVCKLVLRLVKLRVSVSTAILNSLTLVAQRAAPNVVQVLADSCLLDIVDVFATNENVERTTMSVSSAAGMQFIFTALARTQSGSVPGTSVQEQHGWLRRLHMWAVRTIAVVNNSPASANNQVTLQSSLKLVLVLLSVDDGFLSPGATQTTVQVLDSVFVSKEQPEVQPILVAILQTLAH